MAITKTTKSLTFAQQKNELLNELASFLYDAYKRSKETESDKIEQEKGQNAENEGET